MLLTETGRGYGIEQSAVEAGTHAEYDVGSRPFLSVAADRRRGAAFNFKRLRHVGVIALLACAATGCTLQGSRPALDKGDAVALLPAPVAPGEDAGPAGMLTSDTGVLADVAIPGESQPDKASAENVAGGTVEVSIDGLSLIDAVGLAIARHPDVSRAQAVVAQSESEVAIAKSAWYPTIEYEVNPKYSREFRQETYASVGVNQLIYDFGRSRSRISAANATLERERYLLADSIETIAYNTAATFIDLAASQETIAAAERQVNSLRNTKDKIETRLKAGLADASDLNQAEVAIQRAAAEALSARTEFDVAAGKLAEVAGVRPSRVQNLNVTSAFVQSLNGDIRHGIEETPAVLAAQEAMKAAAARVKLAKADRFPAIGVNAGQGISALSSSDNDYDRDTWVGLRLIGDLSLGGFNKHQIEAAEAEQRAQSQALENQRLLTRTALGSAETEAVGAAARLQSYQSVIDLSRSLIDLYWQEYTLDKRPLTDVINAERDVYQSEVARINAIADRDRARIKANAAVGRFVAQLKARKSPQE